MTADGGDGGITTTMMAAVYRSKGEVTIAEVDVPAAGRGEVLIEVSHCGVCGTDLHIVMDGWGVPGSIGGHEYSGTIVGVGPGSSSPGAVGAEGTAPPGIGDRVVVSPARACGTCRFCVAGRASLCVERTTPGPAGKPGAFAHYVVASASQVLPVPTELGLREAALAEPLAVALHALTRAGVVRGDRVMISGAGPIGALALAVLVRRGFSDVVVVEPGPVRAELARALGASEVRHADELDIFTVAEPGRLTDSPVDVVLECSGRQAALEAGLYQLDRAGRLVVVGTGIEPPAFDPNRLLLNELQVIGSFNYDNDGFEQALTMLASGDLPTSLLIHGSDVGLHGILRAMQSLVAGRIPGKVMITPGSADR